MGQLRHFSVTSPEYSQGSSSDYEPPEYGCDYIWVKALTKREAKILAVKCWSLWGKKPPSDILPKEVVDISYAPKFGYCDNRGTNPFKGLKVEEILPCPTHGFEPEGEEFCNCEPNICFPAQCGVCELTIPIGEAKPWTNGGTVHDLCLLPEYNHAEIVLGESYFA